ncbi:MAG: PilZ domain-containing protein [Gemmatimonadales bacterium]|nr:PilZ domain-containing protein [Gemmatimonadales bacterium]
MLLESMKALILAGNQALQGACGLSVNKESIKLVGRGSLTFPMLGTVKITRGTLQKIHLGCNSDLCSLLTNMEKSGGQEDGVDILLEQFKRRLLEEMGGRNPKGKVVSKEIGSNTLFTSGIRTFGFQLETDLGTLFLLAEIPSRVELEQARGSDFLESLISSNLPRDWMHRDRIDSSSLMENFLLFLRKIEGDVEMEFSHGDGESITCSGVLLETIRLDGQRTLKISVDLSNSGAPDPQVGDPIIARFGLRDRSIQFVLPYLGKSSYPVAGDAVLNCMLFAIPEELTLVQRRRAFRINVNSRVKVEIDDLEQMDDPFSPNFGQEVAPLLKGHLVDISFSGARVTSEGISPKLTEGSRILCRIFFPDRPHGLEVRGIIRRSTSTLVGKDQTREDVGIEFLITPETDRVATDAIRQFVLFEQRTWLAKRVHVAGIK